MRARLLALAFGFVSLAVLAAQSTAGEPSGKTVQSGDLRAELTYERGTQYGAPAYTNLRLKLVRAGSVLLDQALEEESYSVEPVLTARDLNGDGEPEVLLDVYTGGAHCCTVSLLYGYDPASGRYARLKHDWADVGYRLRDLDGDRIPELESADWRFAYQFASFAGSAFPLQIWRYRGGGLVDVTRRYPKLVRRDAAGLWRAYLRERNDPTAEVKGILAPYLADRYLLGEGAEGWRRLRRAYRESDREQFFRQLARFLRRTGYVRG